ncbi:hypothetical protein [Anabaena sp. CCY 9402-a]|uniref:hypothetical protein n=1 Tax=Anabaena sp. CCY 9402-a TaxID=3103867 RepID=UPI0039C5CFC8
MNPDLQAKFIEASTLMGDALAQSPSSPPIPPILTKFPIDITKANPKKLDAALDNAILELKIFHYFGDKP